MKLGFLARLFRKTFRVFFSLLLADVAVKYKKRIDDEDLDPEIKDALKGAVDELTNGVALELDKQLS